MPYFLQQVSLFTTGVHNQLEDVYIQGSFGYKIQNLQKKNHHWNNCKKLECFFKSYKNVTHD